MLDVANLREIVKGEVRRILLPRTPVYRDPAVDPLVCPAKAPSTCLGVKPEQPLGRRRRLAALTLAKRRLIHSLHSSFGALYDLLEAVANLLEPSPERLVHRVAHLQTLQSRIERTKGPF